VQRFDRLRRENQPVIPQDVVHVRALGADLGIATAQTALLVAFLAHQSSLMLDAIGRTLFRLSVSRRHLLDWTTAAQVTVSARLDLAGFYRQMASGVGIGIIAALVVAWTASGARPANSSGRTTSCAGSSTPAPRCTTW